MPTSPFHFFAIRVVEEKEKEGDVATSATAISNGNAPKQHKVIQATKQIMLEGDEIHSITFNDLFKSHFKRSSTTDTMALVGVAIGRDGFEEEQLVLTAKEYPLKACTDLGYSHILYYVFDKSKTKTKPVSGTNGSTNTESVDATRATINPTEPNAEAGASTTTPQVTSNLSQTDVAHPATAEPVKDQTVVSVSSSTSSMGSSATAPTITAPNSTLPSLLPARIMSFLKPATGNPLNSQTSGSNSTANDGNTASGVSPSNSTMTLQTAANGTNITMTAPGASTSEIATSSNSTEAASTALASSETHLETELFVGICGATGAGKSSLLNALLHCSDILPTSAMQACTAVVVEIRYRRWGRYPHDPQPDNPTTAAMTDDQTDKGTSVEEPVEELVEGGQSGSATRRSRRSKPVNKQKGRRTRAALSMKRQELEGLGLQGDELDRAIEVLDDDEEEDEDDDMVDMDDDEAMDIDKEKEVADEEEEGPKKYRAEIEFLSQAEWQTHLDTVIAYLSTRERQDDASTSEESPEARLARLEQRMADEQDSAAAASLARVKAIFGGRLYASQEAFSQALRDIPSIAKLLQDHVGKTHFFEDNDPKAIKSRMSPYLAATTGRSTSTQYWPLVKCARVYGPWRILSRGLVLCDLPGVADENSARNAVVASYMDKCRGIIAVAPIARARDNQASKDILTNPRLRQRILAGEMAFLAYVATQADNVAPQEILHELADDFMASYRQACQAYQLLTITMREHFLGILSDMSAHAGNGWTFMTGLSTAAMTNLKQFHEKPSWLLEEQGRIDTHVGRVEQKLATKVAALATQQESAIELQATVRQLEAQADQEDASMGGSGDASRRRFHQERTRLEALKAVIEPRQLEIDKHVQLIDDLRALKQQRQKLLKHYSIMARNGYVTNAIQSDFKHELQELLSGGTSISSTSTGRAILVTTPPKITLNVFGTSAKEYVGLVRDTDGDAAPSDCFFDIGETGIPAILTFLAGHAGFRTTSEQQSFLQKNKMDCQYEMEQAGDVVRIGKSKEADDAELDEMLEDLLREDEDNRASSNSASLNLDQHVASQVADQEAAALAELQAQVGSDGTQKLQSRTKYLTDLMERNDVIAEKLAEVLRAFDNNVANNKRKAIWQTQSDRLSKLQSTGNDSSYQVVIGILGDTGAGKSSTLNALLGNINVLPTSGVQACTAAPIELTYKASNGGGVSQYPSQQYQYSATVEFLTLDEWHEELKGLCLDLADENGRIRRDMRRPNTEAGKIAFDKIRSVYQRIDTYDNLIKYSPRRADETEKEYRRRSKSYVMENDAPVSYLGRMKQLNGNSAKEIKTKLEQVASSRSCQPEHRHWLVVSQTFLGCYWPLVKQVCLSGPFDLLKAVNGKLVDLPGLSDANAARNKVVDAYIRKCSGFLIAAPIQRAIDNKTAKNLLGQQFRRQMLMDGQLGSIAFIATQSDNIDALEISDELGLVEIARLSERSHEEVKEAWAENAPKIRLIRKQVSRISKMRKECNSKLRKWKKKHEVDQEKLAILREQKRQGTLDIGIDDYRSKIQNFRVRMGQNADRIASMTDRLGKSLTVWKKKQIHLSQISHMLNHITATARNAYAKKHLRADFKAGIGELSSMLGGSDGTGFDIESVPELPVFTVSSMEYANLHGRVPLTTWYSENETEIPRLKQYVMHCLAKNAISTELVRAKDLSLLQDSIVNYLQLDQQVNSAQSSRLKQASISIQSENLNNMKAHVANLRSNLTKIILKGPLMKKITSGQQMATKDALQNLRRVESSVHWASYRACIRRHGTYVSPTAGPIDVNEALIRPILDSSSSSWNSTFTKGVDTCFKSFKTTATTEADGMIGKVSTLLVKEGLSAEGLTKGIAPTARLSFISKIDDAQKRLDKTVTDQQRIASRAISECIKLSLNIGYSKGAAECGTGCVARLKAHVANDVNKQRLLMFKKSVSELEKSLDDMLKGLDSTMLSQMRNIWNDLMADVEVVWDSRCLLSATKKTDIVSRMSCIGSKISENVRYARSLKATVSNANFDTVAAASSILPIMEPLASYNALPISFSIIRSLVSLPHQSRYDGGHSNDDSENCPNAMNLPQNYSTSRQVKQENRSSGGIAAPAKSSSSSNGQRQSSSFRHVKREPGGGGTLSTNLGRASASANSFSSIGHRQALSSGHVKREPDRDGPSSSARYKRARQKEKPIVIVIDDSD